MSLPEPEDLRDDTSVPALRIAERLRHCTGLPSPPGIAVQLIELCEEPEVEFDQLLDLVYKDPSLTARLLKIANSPVYGGARQTSNLRQALILFGIDGILNLALSFTLANGLRRYPGNGVDLERFWRRSLTMAIAARAVAKRLCPHRGADLYLAGLLQDLGILALSKAWPELYAGNATDGRTHEWYRQRELKVLGADHAVAGAWLMRNWHMPDWLADVVTASHGAPAPAGAVVAPEQAQVVA